MGCGPCPDLLPLDSPTSHRFCVFLLENRSVNHYLCERYGCWIYRTGFGGCGTSISGATLGPEAAKEQRANPGAALISVLRCRKGCVVQVCCQDVFSHRKGDVPGDVSCA